MTIGSGVSLGPSVDAGIVGTCAAGCGAGTGPLSAALLAGAGVVDSWPCGRLFLSSVGCVSTGGADPAADGVLFSSIPEVWCSGDLGGDVATIVPLVFEGSTGVWPFSAGDLTSVFVGPSLLRLIVAFCALHSSQNKNRADIKLMHLPGG